MQSYLSRGLGGNESRSTASVGEQLSLRVWQGLPYPWHAAPAPRLQVTSPRFESRHSVSPCIYNQKFPHWGVFTETCVLRVLFLRTPESHLLRLTWPQSCCHLPLMSTSTPPPLCDVSTDPNTEHTKRTLIVTNLQMELSLFRLWSS